MTTIVVTRVIVLAVEVVTADIVDIDAVVVVHIAVVPHVAIVLRRPKSARDEITLKRRKDARGEIALRRQRRPKDENAPRRQKRSMLDAIAPSQFHVRQVDRVAILRDPASLVRVHLIEVSIQREVFQRVQLAVDLILHRLRSRRSKKDPVVVL